MGFYCVRVHGGFNPRVELDDKLPFHGFVTTRWVVARDQTIAAEKAFLSAKSELQSKWSAVRDGLISVDMEVEDMWPTGPWRLLLRGGGRGFSFYEEE